MASNRPDHESSPPILDCKFEALTDSSVEPRPLCTACWVVFENDAAPVCPCCGNLAPAAGWAKLPYTFLDRYVFLDILGRGGLGAVFRARHADPDRAREQAFAVKVVQMGARLERHQLLAQMFEREISAAALLGRSRHFVRVLGHDTGKQLHLAMEYVPWPTLKQLFELGPLSTRKVAQLGIAILRPIEVMHAHNLVHRDLKPANIFVHEEKDDDYLVKIADLGLWILDEAHVKDGVTDTLSTCNDFAGTLDFASPEQMMGSGIGVRSDLHAIGSILWCAYAGDVPFPGRGDGLLTALRTRTQEVLQIPPCPPGMPSALYAIISKALQPEPSDRFSSAREFSAALQDFVCSPETGRRTPASPSGSASEANRKGHRPERVPEGDLSAAPSSRALGESSASRRSRMVALAVGMALLGASATVAVITRQRQHATLPEMASVAPVVGSLAGLGGPASAPSTGPTSPRPPAEPGVAQVVVGARHSCAVLGEGTLRCWGANEAGQLGDGTTSPRSSGVQPIGVTQAVDVVLGDAHSCARMREGEVFCWGANGFGQLGDGATSDRAVPTRVDGLQGIEQLHAFACGTLARARDGKVFGWGCNEGGQMGSDGAEDWLRPRQIPALQGAKSLSSIGNEEIGATCAIRQGGVPHCWGWGSEPLRPRLPAFGNLERVNLLVMASEHGCLLLEGGSARCWGNNPDGELGDGTRDARLQAVEVTQIQGLKELALGDHHTCGRTQDGQIYCWGSNAHGQLGQPAPESQAVPKLVPGIKNARQLLASGSATCALTDAGEVICWGDTGARENGDGSSSRAPSVVEGARAIAHLAGEPDRVLCMRTRGGELLCMGDDEHGQLGRGRVAETTTPVQVLGLEGVEKLAAAARNACAITSDSALHCWGSNTWRAFGNDDAKRTRPVQVDQGALDVTVGARGLYAVVQDEAGKTTMRMGGALLRDLGGRKGDDVAYPQKVKLDQVRQLVVGAYHACALKQNGTVSCWGDNAYGQIGDGTAQRRARPTPVPNLKNVVELATGGFHTCARRQDGTVVCWGNNADGQAGPGASWRCRAGSRSYACQRMPRRVVGISKAAGLTAGQWHTCALREGGAVMCWGANANGQLGDGTTVSRPMPAPVLRLSSVRQLAAAERHTCAVLDDGTLRCWGTGARGELGGVPDSTCGPRQVACSKVPMLVEGLRGALQVAAGWEFTCARTGDKQAWCWGNNQRGSLGDGSVVRGDKPEPVAW